MKYLGEASIQLLVGLKGSFLMLLSVRCLGTGAAAGGSGDALVKALVRVQSHGSTLVDLLQSIPKTESLVNLLLS